MKLLLHKIRPTVSIVALSCLLTMSSCKQEVETCAFDIEKGNALVSLTQFASQANVEIQFDSAIVRDVQTVSLHGSMSKDSALEHLLKETALDFEYDRSALTYVITRKKKI